MKEKFFVSIFLLIFAGLFFWRLANFSATQKIDRKIGFKSYVERVLTPRNFLAKTIDKILPEPNASLLNGILFGIRGDIPSDFFRALTQTGIVHVIALSGQNISILLAVISRITLVLGRRMSSVLSICGIIAFILFVGPSASVVRAGVMGTLALIATVFGRQYLSLWGLALSGLVMVLIRSDLIYDIGFQLSFLATLGIILFSQSQNSSAKKNLGQNSGLIFQIKRSLRESLVTTLSAQIFTMPVTLANFGQLSLVSVLTNVLVLWTVPIIMGLGAISAFLGAIILQLGQVAGIFVNWLLSYFVTVVYITSSLPFSAVRVSGFKIWMGFLYYGLVFIFLAVRRLRRI